MHRTSSYFLLEVRSAIQMTSRLLGDATFRYIERRHFFFGFCSWIRQITSLGDH